MEDNGEAIQFGFNGEGGGEHPFIYSGDAFQPRAEVVKTEGVAQAEDGGGVPDFVEAFDRGSANPLGGGIGGDPGGVGGFEGAEFVQQLVVFVIADDRIIQNVIAVIVVVNLLAQMEQVLMFLLVFHEISFGYISFQVNFQKKKMRGITPHLFSGLFKSFKTPHF